jgi:hypothetical protein
VRLRALETADGKGRAEAIKALVCGEERERACGLVGGTQARSLSTLAQRRGCWAGFRLCGCEKPTA